MMQRKIPANLSKIARMATEETKLYTNDEGIVVIMGEVNSLPPRSSSNMSQSQRWKERERNKQNSLPKQKSSQPIPTRPPSQGLNRGRNDGARPPSQASNRGRGDDSRRWSANEPDAGNSNLGRLKDNARDSRTKQPPLRFDKDNQEKRRAI